MMRAAGAARTAVEMGLVGVTATQLWHQTFIDGSLAEVPTSNSVAAGFSLRSGQERRLKPAATDS